MYLSFSDRSRYENLHLSTALEDWDMTEEMKQCTTIDQYFTGAEEKMDRYCIKRQHSAEVSPSRSEEGSPQESTFRPTLWLVVDPNIVIPFPELCTPLPQEPPSTSSHKSIGPDKTCSSVDCSTVEDSGDETLTSSSELCTEDDHCFIPSPRSSLIRRVSSQVKYRKAQVQKIPYERWPRPPINYCNLISLALRNSEDGSLNVQQIYGFVRWTMCTPNDSAVLHAIFNPTAPFGDICGDKDNEIPEDPDLDSRFPADLLEDARELELSGVKAAESGDVKSAVQRFTEAIALLPDRPSAYNNRAQALRLEGDVTGALQDLDRAVEFSKGMGIAGCQALVQRGLILRLKGNDDAARGDFQRAAQLGSDFARQQLILLNPYAALCNRMLRDMVKKLQEPDMQEC